MSETIELAYLQEKIEFLKKEQFLWGIGALFSGVFFGFALWSGNLAIELCCGLLFVAALVGVALNRKRQRDLIKELQRLAAARRICPECKKQIPWRKTFKYCPFCVTSLLYWFTEAKTSLQLVEERKKQF
jgi:hypothetical protein